MPLISVPFISDHEIVLPRKRTGTSFVRMNSIPLELPELDSPPEKIISMDVEGDDYHDKNIYNQDYFSHNGMYYQKSGFSLGKINELTMDIPIIQRRQEYEHEKAYNDINEFLLRLKLPKINVGYNEEFVADLPEHRSVLNENYTEKKAFMEKCAKKIEDTYAFVHNNEIYVRTYLPTIRPDKVVGNHDPARPVGIKLTRYFSDLDGNKVNKDDYDGSHTEYPLEFLSYLQERAAEKERNLSYASFDRIAQDMKIVIHTMDMKNVENFELILSRLNRLPEPDDSWELSSFPAHIMEKYVGLLYSRERWVNDKQDEDAINNMLDCYTVFYDECKAFCDNNERYIPHSIGEIKEKVKNVKDVYEVQKHMATLIREGEAVNTLDTMGDSCITLGHTDYTIDNDNDNVSAPSFG